jgi:hypothetical protein
MTQGEGWQWILAEAMSLSLPWVIVGYDARSLEKNNSHSIWAVTMNHLKLDIISANVSDGTPELRAYRGLQIFVDGVALIEILKAIELPFAEREGHPDLAGNYDWVDADSFDLADFVQYLSPINKKISVLECECGCLGCWPLHVRVTADDRHVIWNEFENPFRSGGGVVAQWTYENLKSFVFDRFQYEAEVAKVAALIAKI